MRIQVLACSGTACEPSESTTVKRALLARLEEELRIRAGETTPDFTFIPETVNCVGCCALAPVVVNDRVLRKWDHKKLWGWIREEGR